MDEAIKMPLGPLLFLYRKQPKKVNQLQTRIISSERIEEEDGKGGHFRQRHLRQCHENHCSQWRTVSQGASPSAGSSLGTFPHCQNEAQWDIRIVMNQ